MRKNKQWTRLDNAAKIFPAASTKSDTKVFRFACELYEKVEQDALQRATEMTLAQFPPFRAVMKRGLFWYYLENSDIHPVVRKEDRPPCSSLYNRNIKTLLFEVSYFHNRINLEVYHALTDGTGALQFLRVLVYHYLRLKHPELGDVSIQYDASFEQKMDDSFRKYYSDRKKPKKEIEKKAYQLKGVRISENRTSVIEGTMPVKSVLEKAHQNQATLTTFLAGIFLCAVGEGMAVHDRRRPVVVTVPVNLRNYFPSESVRNFFSIINVGYDFKNRIGTLEDVISEVNAAFRRELTPLRLEGRLNSLGSIERNIFARITPLFIKDVVLRIAHDISAMAATVSLSNIGRVDMPEEMKPYIRLFDVFVSTNKLQACICSFKETLTVSFTSSFVSTDIQRRFFRTLTDMGIPIEITTNQQEE